MTGRETAWRVLAHEFAAATEEEKGSGERAATYLLTPAGARMNRVLLVGRLGPAEAVGRDETNPFFRARLTDPTGTVTVTAGGFQPRAMAQLRAADASGPSVVVGKAHLYRGRDGVAYGSVRAEAIRPVSEASYRAMLADSVRQTAERIDLARRLRDPSPPSDGELAELGLPEAWVRAGRECLRRYPTADPSTFLAPLGAALETIRSPAASGAPPTPTRRDEPRAPAKITTIPPPAPSRAPSAAERAQESAFLDLVDELAEGSADGYADLREALQRAAALGLREETTEELVSRLEEAGALEEPIVGKVRRA